MNHLKNKEIEKIRAACIKANLDKECANDDGSWCAHHAIRLADVLLVIEDKDIVIGNNGMFLRIVSPEPFLFKPLYKWNLRTTLQDMKNKV